MSNLVPFTALGAFSPRDELALTARIDFLHELGSLRTRFLGVGERDCLWKLLASTILGEPLPPTCTGSYAVLHGDDMVAAGGHCYVRLNGEWRHVSHFPSPHFRIVSGWLMVSSEKLEDSEIKRITKIVAENPVPEVAAKFIGEENIPVALATIRNRVPLDKLSGLKAMWCATDRGRVRGNNEDGAVCASFRVSGGGLCQSYRLLAVSDGAGGHGHGEIASRETLNGVLYRTAETILMQGELGEEERLREIVLNANERVIQARMIRRSNMASTLTMVLIKNNVIFTAHVGDSRAYYIDRSGIEQLTEDHKYVEELVKKGIITRQQARTHPQRNIITSALGMPQPRIDVARHSKKYIPGTRLLVCSDGLSDLLEDWEIQRIVMGALAPTQAAAWLINTANQRGGYDNISVALDFFL